MAVVEHVIVLMLENRSFDHVLGFLDHPDKVRFHGLTGSESNVAVSGDAPITVSDDGAYTIDPGPGHSHGDAMMQLTGNSNPARPYKVDNSGFAQNFEQRGSQKKGQSGLGRLIMRCQHERRVPVLATLAREFAVCDHWFCSVPGETWPNRNFAHAATADGEVNIKARPYTDKTIFEQLSAANRSWNIYHAGAVCQSMAFRKLWVQGVRRRFRPLRHLYRAIEHDRLPNYAFVEPDYIWPDANSQHPFNNRKKGSEFLAGERLIQDIYEALITQPNVWEKTLFVITYDEHGGFYDHVPPPQGDRYRDGRVAENGFMFDLLGPRVPTVLVSPYIPKGKVDNTVYDHSSIVATVRTLFAPHLPPLTTRDAQANTFHHNVSLDIPRSQSEIPHFQLEEDDAFALDADVVNPPPTEIDDFQESIFALMHQIDVELTEDAMVEAFAADDPVPSPVAALVADQPLPPLALEATVAYREGVARRFAQSATPLTTLYTASGETLDNPTNQQMATALHTLPQAGKVWLDDNDEHALTITGNGRILYESNGDIAEREGNDVAAQFQLSQLFLDGDFAALNAELAPQ